MSNIVFEFDTIASRKVEATPWLANAICRAQEMDMPVAIVPKDDPLNQEIQYTPEDGVYLIVSNGGGFEFSKSLSKKELGALSNLRGGAGETEIHKYKQGTGIREV